MANLYLVLQRTGATIDWYAGYASKQAARTAAETRAQEYPGTEVEVWVPSHKVVAQTPPVVWETLGD